MPRQIRIALAIVLSAILVALILTMRERGSSSDTTSTSGDPRIITVLDYRTAREQGDLETARAQLGDDPRVWWEVKEGPGREWKLGGELWRKWDDHFRSESNILSWETADDHVALEIEENNDFYRLTDRGPQRYRQIYYFGPDGRISGYMIQGINVEDAAPGRFEEFENWARRHRAAELAYLLPDNEIDPTGDRSRRFRALLNEWRESEGLPRIE